MLKSCALFSILASLLVGCASPSLKEQEESCPQLELYWEICDLGGESMACLNLQDTQKLKAFMIRCQR
jgi:hypothetical protein